MINMEHLARSILMPTHPKQANQYISDTQTAYWFARGYYDGRAIGTENRPDGLNDAYGYAYRLGYDMGVSDHCDLDIEETK